MAEADTSPSTTAVMDVDVDSLAHCATYVSLQDLSNMGMSCKYLKRVAYSDSIWSHCFSSGHLLLSKCFPELRTASPVPLWCFLCLHEVEGAGDKELDVDF